MTLVEIRPETAARSVRLVWFATGDCRSCTNHEAMEISPNLVDWVGWLGGVP